MNQKQGIICPLFLLQAKSIKCYQNRQKSKVLRQFSDSFIIDFNQSFAEG